MKLLARGVALAVVLSAIVVLRSASPAFACSCVGIDRVLAGPLDSFSAAFVGTVVDAPPAFSGGNSARLVTWTFEVEAVYLGELPATVEVKSEVSGASCGFERISEGSRLGVLLRRDGGSWKSGLCASGAPEKFAVLGPAAAPSAVVAEQSSSSSNGRVLFAIAGAGIVAMLGVVVWRRRRVAVQ
jgi:hypothetical protein